jgi:hypothetical protein
LEQYFSFKEEKGIYKLFIRHLDKQYPFVNSKFNKPGYAAMPISESLQYVIKNFHGKCLIKTKCKIGFNFEIYYSNQSDAEEAVAWLNSLLLLEKICQ